MKIRDLIRQEGHLVASAWPPRWIGSFHPVEPEPMPGEAILEAVTHSTNVPVLSLTMKFEGLDHSGLLRWDEPPTLQAVETLIRANLGRTIDEIGELDI